MSDLWVKGLWLSSAASTTRNLGYLSSLGVEVEHGVDVCCLFMLIVVWFWWHLTVCHQDYFHKASDYKPITLKIQKSWPTPRIIPTPTATIPQKGSLPLWHTAHQATSWTPTLTPHKDAFLHHLWGGVAQYSVWEIGPDKRKWGIRGEGGRTLLQTCSLSFLGSGQRRYSTSAWLYS